ncbi:MAG: MFS transporter [Deltaproteobacteria bacterium]|nr:MFS transporter [Deltaproteobacteria bacterium]
MSGAQGSAASRWDGPYSLRYTLWVRWLVLLVSAFSTLDRTMVSILIDEIGAEFSLSDTQLGLLLGPAFGLVYAFLTLPLARLADLWVRRNIVAASLFLWSLFTAATFFAKSFAVLFVTRMGVGIGEAGGTAPNVSLLSDYLPPQHRARGVSVISIGATLGMGVGMVIGGNVAETQGWRAAFLFAGIPGVFLAALYLATVREPKRGASEASDHAVERPTLREVMSYLIASRTYLVILLANAFSLFAAMGRNLWEPAFIIRIYDMGPADAGLWYFLTSPVPSAFGIWLGGRLADGLGVRDARWYLWIPALGQLLSVPILIGFLLWPETHTIAGIPFAFVLSFFGSIVGSFFTAPFMATIQGLSKLRMRAIAAGVSTLISTLVGLCAGPLLVGMLSDAMQVRFGEDSLRYSLLIPTAAPLLSVLVCVFGARRVAADLARAKLGGGDT